MCVLVARPVHESSISLSFAKLMNYSNVKGSVKRDGEIKRRPRQTEDGGTDGQTDGRTKTVGDKSSKSNKAGQQ